ncbi:restriction endonuclease subunit S [Tenacibaculum mesophilum]|uniref:restriction endonuclease subunit S n=1 Tax=Tenacibaculum mesophilum TaxID=104268 RepID=UPI003F631C5F
MLEGLEISIKLFSELNFNNPTHRLDSEFYKKEYINLFKTVFSKNTEKLNTLSEWTTQGPNPKFSESTIPCLTGRNISGGRVDYNNADYVSISEYNNLKRFQLKIGDTLITLKGKGSIGKIGYVTDSRKAIFSRDIGVIRPNKINPAYLNAYLLSKYGSKIIARGETGGTGQSTLTASYLKNIDVVKLNIENEIGNIVENSEKKLNTSKLIYSQAENLLLEEIGFKDFTPNRKLVNIKNFKDSFGLSGRLDSEYYSKDSEDLILKIKSKEFELLGNICKTKRGNFISKTFYCKENEGKYYLRGGDFSSNQLKNNNTINISENFIPSNEYLTETGDILIALIGSVGTLAIVTDKFTNSYISNNIGVIRITDKQFLPEYIHLFLTSRLGKVLFDKIEMRTAQPKISDKDIFEFPIPKLDVKKQQQIANLIEESFALKKQSENLLEIAKRAVEIAIEENEEAAIAYINKQSNSNG